MDDLLKSSPKRTPVKKNLIDIMIKKEPDPHNKNLIDTFMTKLTGNFS